jgi:hypothetical protein
MRKTGARRWTLAHRTALLGLALATGACAPKQRIPLEAGPAPLWLYVDGELQPALPDEIELRSDRDHMLYFKKPGYASELVVLESRERDGRARLEPGAVRVELAPRGGSGRDLEIETEEPLPAR